MYCRTRSAHPRSTGRSAIGRTYAVSRSSGMPLLSCRRNTTFKRISLAVVGGYAVCRGWLLLPLAKGGRGSATVRASHHARQVRQRFASASAPHSRSLSQQVRLGRVSALALDAQHQAISSQLRKAGWRSRSHAALTERRWNGGQARYVGCCPNDRTIALGQRQLASG